MSFFLVYGQLMRHPLKLFHLSTLLQMPNDHRLVDVKFFGNFWYSCKRITFDDCSQQVLVNFWWPAITLFIFKALVSFAKLLEPPLHYTVRSSWAECIVDVVSCPCCFKTHFDCKKKNKKNKNTSICFFSNIISKIKIK